MSNQWILNDTIMPGYQVTKPPVNLWAFNMLQDGTTRNFGRETQYVTYNNPAMTPLQALLARNFTHTNHISQWNPMLFGFNLDSCNTNPYLTQAGLENAFDYGALLMKQSLAKLEQQKLVQAVQNIDQTMSSMEQTLSKLVDSDKLTDAQKSKLKALIKEIQAKKAEFQKKLEKSQSKETVEAIQGELLTLQEKISKVAKEITEEVQKNTNSDETSEEVRSSDDETVELTSDESKKLKELQKERLEKAADACKDMYMATIGNSDWLGRSDNTKVTAATAKLDKNKTAAAIVLWDEQYASSGKSMIKAMFDGDRCWNGENTLTAITNIVKNLESRAKELGIYTELVGHFTVAFDELDDIFVDEGKVEAAVKTIAQAIVEKEVEFDAKLIKDDTKKANNTKKADDKKKAEEESIKKAEEAKKLFLQDMREIFEDDSLEVSDSVKYEDGNFTIRIKGEDYSGSTFNELRKAVKKAGYDPLEYLAKKKLDYAS